MPPEPPRHIDILHQRQRLEAADRAIERRGDEQPLVAVRQRQPPAAPGDHSLDATRRGRGIVEPEAEIAGASVIAGVADASSDPGGPTWTVPRLGVYADQP